MNGDDGGYVDCFSITRVHPGVRLENIRLEYSTGYKYMVVIYFG